MNISIIGCGLIGHKRARTLGNNRLLVCADTVRDKAIALARDHGGSEVAQTWQEAVWHPAVDIVIIATTHDNLAPIAIEAIKAGKHVLLEKPAGRNTAELDQIIEASRTSTSLVRVGFNHRYHPAFRQALKIFAGGELGEMMFIRGRYGHGGRLGYDKEWRASKKIAGGGELIDQGLHLIDLARLFLGDFTSSSGFAPTCFWDMEVEDNGFMLLKTDKNQTAFLHASWTEWKNTFSFEIYGRNGKLEICGLGGSYGLERLAYYKMLPAMGPPETVIWEYPGADTSWDLEFAEFTEDIRLNRQPAAGLADARAALTIVEKIYQDSGR